MSTWPDALGVPQFSGYGIESASQIVRTDMEGGAARVRRRTTSAPDTAPLRFVFNETQMATFRAFWDAEMLSGAAWTYIPVKTGRASGLVSKECRSTDGKFKASLAGAKTWVVEFSVEVRNA